MKLALWVLLSLLGVEAVMGALDGTYGKIFRVDPARQCFELLTETAFDPKTDEGRSRHTVTWTDKTRFVKVARQNSFDGLTGDCRIHIRSLNADNAAAAAAGRDFVGMCVTVLAPDEDGAWLARDANNLLVPFHPDPTSDNHRGGTVELNGKRVGFRLRGPGAEVDIRTVASAADLEHGFWATTLHGRPGEGSFVAERMELYPQVDPRVVDDPKLPRILVVGDSISMNYHDAVKAALKGKANYYRNDGNGGPSDRGVVCMELWLGDYTQPGLQWDVIQFNHGLHDLKQGYDKETKQFTTYQVPVEAYKVNLEKEIQILKKTGAVLVWCTTTPVPNNAFNPWANRRKDADLLYNAAAREVMARHPEIVVNDLNRFVRENPALDAWRKQADVHFWDGNLQQIVGRAVAEALEKVMAGSRNSGERK